MFDQKDVEAYRRIKAPEELREQVMRLEQKPEPTRTRTKWISFGSLAAAACAAVLFIAALPPFAVRGETALLYQGVPIGAEPVSIPADHPQMTSGLREVSGGIPLALETGEDPVNNPIEYVLESIKTIYSIKHKNGAIRRDGTEAEISEDVLLYWDLSGTEDTMFSLTLKTNGKQLTYVLSMRDDGGYDLQQNQSPK